MIALCRPFAFTGGCQEDFWHQRGRLGVQLDTLLIMTSPILDLLTVSAQEPFLNTLPSGAV